MPYPRLRVLEPADLEAIDAATRALLANSGIDVHSAAARKALEAAGAEPVPGSHRIRIPDSVLTERLRKAPHEILLASRDGKRDIRVPDGRTHVATDGCGVNVLDVDSGERRESTAKDLADLTRVGDALEPLDYQWPLCVAGDVPSEIHDLVEAATALENTTKHIQHEALSEHEAEGMIDMAAAIVGGRKELRRRPLVSSIQCPVSPMVLEEGSTEALMAFGRAGVPVAPMSMVLLGGSSPVDLASALVVSNAEILASVVVSQVAAPGAPIFWSIASGPIDMRSGSFGAGSPEMAVLSAAGAELARHYHLPSLVASLGCDADTPGFQAAVEKMGTGMASLLAGPDAVSGIGGLDTDNTMSLEQLVLDAEIVDYIQRVMRPFPVNDASIHMDMLTRVGPAGNYLKEKHTLLHFREALWSSRLLLREGFVEGRPNEERVRARAKARVHEILSTHEVAPLPADVHRRIWAIAKPGTSP
jgi:trimethylamine:corrinoid methyltransferase-like protein